MACVLLFRCLETSDRVVLCLVCCTSWPEHLLEKLRLPLKRLCIPGCMSPVNVSVYADDLVAFSEKNIDLLATDIGVLSLISSAKVNWE